MQELFIQILNSGIIASYIIVAVILIRLIFKKLPKRTLVLLWALVAIKLILPFSFESSLSLVPESNPIPQTIIATPAPDVNSDTDVQPIIPPTDFEDGFAPSVPNNNVTVPDNNVTVSQPNYTFIALCVWLAGVGVLLIYGAVSYALLYRRVLGATPLFDNIRQHEKVHSPFILGFIKPKIYVPYNLDESTLKNVILHENAHIKYCDHLIKPFAFILLTVYWFNPLVWVSYILLCRDIEFACDERVVVQLPENARSNYAEALVKCGVNRLRISACPIAFGETGIKERVKNIMNYKKPAFWILITAVLLTIAITVCFLTVNPEDSADKTTDSSPTPTISALPSQTPLTPETHMTPDPSPTPIKPKNDMANEELAQVVAKLLRVPDKEGITHDISDKFYWEAAESYYKYVAFYENDEVVASACVDPRDGELLRNIFLYSAPEPITPTPTHTNTSLSTATATPTAKPTATPTKAPVKPTPTPVPTPQPFTATTYVPQGGVYTSRATGRVYNSGEKFPTLAAGDVFIYGDYEYRYKKQSQVDSWENCTEAYFDWGVRVLDDSKTSYGRMLDEINGAPVNNLLKAFQGCKNLKTAPIISQKALSLSAAFRNCYALETAPVIPNGVKWLTSSFQGTAIKTPPAIPSSATDVAYMFAFCESLEYAPVFPAGITGMTRTFIDCTSLTYVPDLPNGITDLSYTFSGCTSLKTAPKIPDSVTVLCETFMDCTSLTTVPNFPKNIEFLSSTYAGCSSLKSIPSHLPEKAKSIDYAFDKCTSLKNAPVIPNSVFSTQGVFRGCTSLTGNVVVHANPTYYSNMFGGINFKTQNITLSGSSTMLAQLRATGIN
ncbi:MAG: leucine-rich repeat protein [Clostridia bacterium]|nr:leucine-rich repeat protein [Clostridia bacterium]